MRNKFVDMKTVLRMYNALNLRTQDVFEKKIGIARIRHSFDKRFPNALFRFRTVYNHFTRHSDTSQFYCLHSSHLFLNKENQSIRILDIVDIFAFRALIYLEQRYENIYCHFQINTIIQCCKIDQILRKRICSLIMKFIRS